MTLALPRTELTTTGLNLPADLTYDEWSDVGQRLFDAERAVMWWIGDWWRFGEHRYGERAAQALNSRYSYQTFKDAGWVAGAVEPSRRRDLLSFSHHKEVAALPPEEQDYWLDAAEAGEWSRNDLRARVKLGRTEDDAIPYHTAQDVDAIVKTEQFVSHVEALDALRSDLAAEIAQSHLRVRSRPALARRLRQVGTYLGHVALVIEQEDTDGSNAAA